MLSISPIFILILLLLPAMPVASDQTLSLVSLNAFRLFDDRDDGHNEKILSSSAYHSRLRQLSTEINNLAHAPDIIALQEIENHRVLQDLAGLLQKPGNTYRSVFIEGNDFSRINQGFLVHERLRLQDSQLWFAQRSIAADGHKLFSRPPLEIRVCLKACFSVVNVHLRSMRGLGNSRKRFTVADKRRQQAEHIAREIQQRLQRAPDSRLLIVGDFNALPRSDRHVDVYGTILGNPDQITPRWKSPDLLDPDLIDLTRNIPEVERYSYVYRGRKQQLDHALASPALAELFKKAAFITLDRSVSDHSALSLTLEF